MTSTVNKVPALGNAVQPELQREMNDHANRLNEIVGIEGLAGQTGVVHVVNGEPSASLIVTADITDDAVTYAKIQNVSATDKVLGRATAGAGNVEEITCTAAGRALLDDADAAAQRATLGLSYGKQSFVIWANGWRSLGGAAPGTLTDSLGHPWDTLDFDQATDEFAIAVVPMPKGADLTAAIQFHVYWSASAGSGTVNWTISATSLGDDDALGQAYNTGSAVTDTLLATSDMHISPEAGGLVLTSGGASPQAHDMLKLLLQRDVSEDTLNADARLIAIKFTYSVNAGNDN